jgi:hypothetical protein
MCSVVAAFEILMESDVEESSRPSSLVESYKIVLYGYQEKDARV